MVLLGPAPAVAIGLGTTLAYAAISRRPFQNVLTNSAVWRVFAAVGGLMSEALARDGDTAIRFCAVVVLVYMTTNILNFLLIAAYHRATAGFRLLASGKSVYLTMLPSEIATALLTAGSRLRLCAVGNRSRRSVRCRPVRLPVPGLGGVAGVRAR